MSEAFLGQFLLVKEQSNWVENREKGNKSKNKSKNKNKSADSSNNE